MHAHGNMKTIPLSQSETFTKGELSNAQLTTDRVILWSLESRVWLIEATDKV